MLSYIKGIIGAKTENAVIIVNNDLGYEVVVPVSFWRKLKNGQVIECFLHEHIREDARQLFGFESMGELKFFKKLISISGIGPKVGILTMSVGSLDELQIAIANGNVSYITAVPGIGTKIAQKIILEMKGRLDLTEGTSVEEKESVEALESLGYSAMQARDALRQVSPSITDVGDRVRAALRLLGQKVR